MKHIPYMTLRNTLLNMASGTMFDVDDFDGLVDVIREWYEANNKPKPYSDPSMKEVLEKEFAPMKFELRKLDNDLAWKSMSGHAFIFVDNGEYAAMDKLTQPILAARGYFPDDMFEDGKFKY